MKKQFELITLLSTYVYLKEKYTVLDKVVEEKNQTDIKKILELLRPLEKFIVLPDKVDTIEHSYEILEKFFNTGTKGRESDFFNEIKNESEELGVQEKEEIINILLYVCDEDKKISDIEKELILQISHLFGLEKSYNELEKSYKNSVLRRKTNWKIIALISLLAFSVLFGSLYLLYKDKTNTDVKFLKDEKVMFNEVFFNRFVIYKNKYIDSNEHFAKQAVFYISGSAEVGFEPKNIVYDESSKTVTYRLPKMSPFLVETNFDNIQLIDSIEPQSLSEKEAKTLAIGIGIAGAFVGGLTADTLTSFSPNILTRIGGTALGATVGGLGSGLVSFSVLNNLNLSKKISLEEEDMVKEKSQQMIQLSLELNPDLVALYRKEFKSYIEKQYALRGIVVDVEIIEGVE